MDTPNVNKDGMAFSKSAIRIGLDALSAFTGQAAVASDMILGATPFIPEEGRKAASTFFKEGQKGLASVKTHVERSLELDWTAKDAPMKNLEEMESLCKEAFSRADEIKKDSNAFIEKASRQLPREAKPLVDLWSDAMNNSYEFYKSFVTRNLELARSSMSDASLFTPEAEPKAPRNPSSQAKTESSRSHAE